MNFWTFMTGTQKMHIRNARDMVVECKHNIRLAIMWNKEPREMARKLAKLHIDQAAWAAKLAAREYFDALPGMRENNDL